jgi:hypothetical protein
VVVLLTYGREREQGPVVSRAPVRIHERVSRPRLNCAYACPAFQRESVAMTLDDYKKQCQRIHALLDDQLS